MEIEGLLSGDETLVAELDDAGEMEGNLSNDILSMEGLLSGDDTIEAFLSDDDNALEGALSDDDRTLDGELAELRPGVMSWNGETGDVTYTPPVQSVNGQTGDVEIAVPTKTSDLTNDSSYISTETDPTVPAWAKSPTKPTYTAAEVGALPDSTSIPSKTSDLTNDSGYISTETDPTVPSWAKSPTKPSYTATEVGALPANTAIPSKTSDLTNDSGYITNAVSNLLNYYTKSEVDSLTALVKDLGSFDIEDYDWDYWEYLADKTESGFYKVFEEQDGFTYFFQLERAGDCCYQEIWSTEENGLARSVRTGWFDGEEWNWGDPQYVMFSEGIYANFYTKNQVDTKLRGKVDNDTLGSYYTDAQVDDILENNYYTSDQVDDLLDGFAPNNMILTTWANLVSLRDNGQLTAGAYYRITDYNFVTSKLGIQSGNHQFDIVVLAISESMVSESAYAVRHSGDHYFEREVTEGGIEWLYTVYVDDYAENYGDEPVDHADDIHSGDIFCYADTDIHPDTGEEVPILYKTDANEYDFDDPDWEDVFYWCGTYDLDGDEYDLWGKYEYGEFMQQYALTPIVVEDGELVVSPVPETKTVPVNLNAWELKYCLDNDKELFAWADTNGKGVIYYMKDEFGNEAPYDFKNVKYARRYVSSVGNSILNNIQGQYVGESDYYSITTTSSVQYRYTFDDNNGNDASLFGDASYNSIDTWIVDGQKQLNNIVTGYAKNSHFRPNTHDVTVANSCLNMDMQGDSCLFYGANALTGTFRYCTMVNANNISAEGGLRTTISSGASTIKVNGNCYDMNWASNLANSEFVGGSFGITFGNYCSNIKIGSNCNTITFGTYCVNITIGANCHTITFTNYWRYVDILDNCSRVTLSTTSGSTTNYVQYITVGKAVTNVTLTPTRKLSYETIYYKTGRVETAV